MTERPPVPETPQPTTDDESDQSRVDGVPSDPSLGSTASDIRLLRCVKAWASARENRLREKHLMEQYQCVRQDRGEPEISVDGTPPCYRSHEPVDEWCGMCQRRDPHFRTMVQLKYIERGYMRGLCSLLDRRAKARTAAAVDPVASTQAERSTRV